MHALLQHAAVRLLQRPQHVDSSDEARLLPARPQLGGRLLQDCILLAALQRATAAAQQHQRLLLLLFLAALLVRKLQDLHQHRRRRQPLVLQQHQRLPQAGQLQALKLHNVARSLCQCLELQAAAAVTAASGRGVQHTKGGRRGTPAPRARSPPAPGW
jgi:hypothetical protein